MQFNYTVTQLLCVHAKACRDNATAVAFLSTRVKSPDENNWGKLKKGDKIPGWDKTSEVGTLVDNLE